MKTLLKIAALTVLLLLILAVLLPAAATAETRWYAVTLAGQKTGYLKMETRRTDGPDGPERLETRGESRFILNRLGSTIDMGTVVTMVESPGGELLSFRSETRMSEQVMVLEGTLAGGALTLTTPGNEAAARTLPAPGVILGPQGIQAASRVLWSADEAPRIAFRTFSPELTRILDAERAVEGRESVTTPWGEVACLRVRESYAGLTLVRTLWLDADGAEVKTLDASPFGEMIGLWSTAAAADLADAGNIPEEQYVRTTAKSNVRLSQARLIDAIDLRLAHLRPEAGWPAFEAPGQTVIEKSADRLVLRIDRTAPDGAPLLPPGPEDLAANAYIDPNDPEIRRIAVEVAGQETDARRKAILLENWVTRNMTFDTGIVIAPTREVVRRLRGTCTEFAVLLTALARSAGIPARYVMGYVYLDGMWGGHAWAALFIDGRWTAFDAAVNGPGEADAARIAFAVSDLSHGFGDLVLSGQQLFSQIGIEILSYRRDGAATRVPAGQVPYRLDGDVYENPGLGMRLVKPPEFVYRELDRTWPDKGLLEMSGPNGRRVAVSHDHWRPGRTAEAWIDDLLDAIIPGDGAEAAEAAGRPAGIRAADGRAAAAVLDGVDAWVVDVEGPDARALLGRVLDAISLGRPPAPPSRTDWT